MKKIAVTGASGFIGNTVCRHLIKEGYQLRVLIRHTDEESLFGLDVQRVTGDLFISETLDELMRDCDIVIHLAGKVSIYPDEHDEILQTNIEGVKNIIAACKRNGVNKLIHFSSIHAHKGFGPDVPIDENTDYSTDKSSPYDYSKAQGEQLVIDARSKGFSTVIVNPTAVIGPHDYQPSLSGQLLCDIYSGNLGSIVNGGFNWVDSRDLAIAVEAIIKKDVNNEQFILAGHWVSFKYLANRVCKVKGKKYKGFNSPLFLAYMGLPLINLISKITKKLPLYTSESLKAIKEGSKHIDCSHANNLLDYSPRPFDETIDDSVHWLVKHFQLNHG
jgi:dihydroflavonol-4-reductase